MEEILKRIERNPMDQDSTERRHQPRLLSSRRITITVPNATFEALEERSSQEGRSLSNLAAFLLEFQLERR